MPIALLLASFLPFHFDNETPDLLEYRSTLLKDVSVSEQVIMAYIQGNCYYKLGKYEEAFRELKFVESRGGNTKYVVLAKDLIKKIPGNYTENAKCIKHGIHKIHTFLTISCFAALLSVIIDYYFSHGSSVEKAYSRRYLCAESELTSFYQEEIGNYKLVLLEEREKIAYCLFKEISNSDYKIIYSFRVNKKSEDEQTNQVKIELTENGREFYQEIEADWEAWEVITGFYQKNNIFYEEDLTYIGISYSPMVENIMINGSPVNIEQIINVDGISAYFWRAENLNLEESIIVDYVDENVPKL